MPRYEALQSCRVRRGSLLLEGIAGLVALGIILILINKLTIGIDRQWQLTKQDRLATETLDNAIEIVSALDWSSITDESLPALAIPEHFEETLCRSSLVAEIKEEASPVVAKRIHLTVAWQPTPGAKPRRRSLTTWIYAAVGSAR